MKGQYLNNPHTVIPHPLLLTQPPGVILDNVHVVCTSGFLSGGGGRGRGIRPPLDLVCPPFEMT